MRLLFPAVALAVALALAVSCGPSSELCDRSDQTDITAKVGACSGTNVGRAKVLGAKTQCNDAIPRCTDADEPVLKALLDCWDAVPVCAAGGEANWSSLAASCERKRAELTVECQAAFFGAEPFDAGTEDAGDGGRAAPFADDAGALDLFITADEKAIAMAWTRSQRGTVSRWEVHGSNVANLPDPVVSVTPDSRMFHTEPGVGSGTRKKYFVCGVDGQGNVVMGDPSPEPVGDDGGSPVPDGGTPCTKSIECPETEVCGPQDICVPNPCATDAECSLVEGYTCNTGTGFCQRTVDAGTPVVDGGVVTESKRFCSELQEISTMAPEAPVPFGAEKQASVFGGKNMDVVAIDTARQYVIQEFEGQIIGYYTEDRGKTFTIDALDTGGTRPRLAYEPKSRLLFACYNAGPGIRIRLSKNYGKTWSDSGGIDLRNDPPDDGGAASLIQDCDIAPWTEGQAFVAAIEDDIVKLWSVNGNLGTQGPDIVFGSSDTIFGPKDVAIATLPDDLVQHVVFTVTKLNKTSGTTNLQVKSQYRDQSTQGAFVDKGFMHLSNAVDQYSAAIATDPVSKRAIGAFVLNDPRTSLETVFVSLWNKDKKQWETGGDMDVFVVQPVSKQFIVMAERKPSEQWMANSPSVAVTPQGKIGISFAAGRVVGTNDVLLQPWFVAFDLERPSDLSPLGKGWFVPTARKISSRQVVSVDGAPTGGPVITADQQISFYFGFMEAGTEVQAQAVPLWPIFVPLPK